MQICSVMYHARFLPRWDHHIMHAMGGADAVFTARHGAKIRRRVLAMATVIHSSSWLSLAPNSRKEQYQTTHFLLLSGASAAPGVTPSAYRTICHSRPACMRTEQHSTALCKCSDASAVVTAQLRLWGKRIMSQHRHMQQCRPALRAVSRKTCLKCGLSLHRKGSALCSGSVDTALPDDQSSTASRNDCEAPLTYWWLMLPSSTCVLCRTN